MERLTTKQEGGKYETSPLCETKTGRNIHQFSSKGVSYVQSAHEISDGCGGSCGTCVAGETCAAGHCVCVPDCGASVCGDNGCGGSCGTCPAGQFCQNGVCKEECVPECGDKQCGGDGCGGSCGNCTPAEDCNQAAESCLAGFARDASAIDEVMDRVVMPTLRQMAADGGYASGENLREAKALQVEDVVFHKKRGLKVEEMAKSPWVYRKLRNFRAGIEAGISCMKRAYGLGRCTWKGLAHFKAYVWSAVVAHNLALFGRLKPA